MKFITEYMEFDPNDQLIVEGYINEIKNTISKIKSPNDAKEYLQQSIDKVEGKKFSIKKKVLLYFLGVIFSMIPYDSNLINDIAIQQSDEEIKEILINYTPKEMVYKGDLNDFLKQLAFEESSDDWQKIDNDSSHVGKYQFGNIALKDIGKKFTVTDFADSTDIWPEKQQDKDIIKLLKKNKHYLRNHLHYIGTVVDSIPVTLSGMLAASHLLGSKPVRDYLDGKKDNIPKDGKGTSLLSYLDRFGGFDLQKLD